MSASSGGTRASSRSPRSDSSGTSEGPAAGPERGPCADAGAASTNVVATVMNAYVMFMSIDLEPCGLTCSLRTLARSPLDGFLLTFSYGARHDAHPEEQPIALDLFSHRVELRRGRALRAGGHLHEQPLEVFEQICDAAVAGCRSGLAVEPIGGEQLLGLRPLS